MLEKIRNHIKEHKTEYACAATAIITAVGVAGITALIMRGRCVNTQSLLNGRSNALPRVPETLPLQHIQDGVSVLAQGGSPVLGDSVTTNNVFYISANRQGPPSWVIRCIETGEIFTSQKAASIAMSLPASEISKHLTGSNDGDVRGFHFERICLAA